MASAARMACSLQPGDHACFFDSTTERLRAVSRFVGEGAAVLQLLEWAEHLRSEPGEA
jgi:hypothetical protein